jgi:hypothetical protein
MGRYLYVTRVGKHKRITEKQAILYSGFFKSNTRSRVRYKQKFIARLLKLKSVSIKAKVIFATRLGRSIDEFIKMEEAVETPRQVAFEKAELGKEKRLGVEVKGLISAFKEYAQDSARSNSNFYVEFHWVARYPDKSEYNEDELRTHAEDVLRATIAETQDPYHFNEGLAYSLEIDDSSELRTSIEDETEMYIDKKSFTGELYCGHAKGKKTYKIVVDEDF